VNIIRSIPNKELGGYYTSCDIYAQVLENLEGVPIPVLEAMACGLPVVMSNHDTSYSEIIDDAVIFSKNSGVDFAEAFKKLLSNPKLREQMKKKSLEVINNINGEKMERKELELYHSLIKTRKERI
jgi:glycosyltransferase involved in cell wall biosynthesis